MDFPWPCSKCGTENLVDLEKLVHWPIDRIVIAEGFFCVACGAKVVVTYWTSSLMDATRKLKNFAPRQHQFGFHLMKAAKKALLLRERIESSRGP